MFDIVLQLNKIKKSFGATEVLRGIDLSVERSEFVTLLGPSGCGKTTTLRIIGGLTDVDEGQVILNGEDVTALPPNKRNVNTVFQNYALFPHMNVEANVGYGMKIRGKKKSEIAERVEKMLALVQLEGYGKRRPEELSGGQRQRVAIARALVLSPDVLLLDEPLGALDLKLRREMQSELKSIQKSTGIAFVYITHDQDEALAMSDRIAVMQDGHFVEIGTPDEVYSNPKTRFVAEFIGFSNFLPVKNENGKTVFGGQIIPDAKGEPSETLFIRPENVRFGRNAEEGFALNGRLCERNYVGGVMRTSIELKGGIKIVSSRIDDVELCPGDSVFVSWRPENAGFIR